MYRVPHNTKYKFALLFMRLNLVESSKSILKSMYTMINDIQEEQVVYL